MLTGYDGCDIIYDSIGNPLSDGKRTYTWEHGRELATVTQDGSTWTNTYGADGLRTKRTDGTTTYRYRYTAGQLATMNIDDDVEMWFMYDDNGPLVIKYGNAESHKVYHYELNLQGDIIAIVSTTGERVVEYTYDAWGNVLSITGSAANTIGVHNPLRYRGYIYDPETQLYYCQSRYYNPEVGRFLNADSFTTTGQGFIGNNMFAYCGNNPVNYSDPYGTNRNDAIRNQFATIFLGNYSGGGGGAIAIVGGSALAGLISSAAQATASLLTSVFREIREFSQAMYEDRVARAEAQIFRTVRQNSSVRYWTATVQRGYVDIGRPLTFNQAVHEVCAGRSVFAVTWYEAKAVAIAAGGRSGYNNKSLYPEIDSGKEGIPGYYYHYHTYDRSGGHVYYLFGEA